MQNKVRVACASADVVSLIVMPEDYGFTPDINYGTDGRNNNSLSSMKSRNLQRVHRTSSNTGFGAVNGLGAGDSSADSMSPKETDVDPKLSAWRSELWISANKTLLLSYKPATIAATGGSSKSAPTKHSSNHHDVLFARTASSPGNLLWSKVFRKPFLHQVESALHASSVSGLYRVQQRMMRALYCVGVVVNLVSSPRSLGLEDDGTSTECIMTIKPVVVPATRLSRTRQTARMQCSSVDVYHLAEELRLCLNRELIDLRTGIQLSEDENESEEAGANSNVTDKESSHSLARSVQIYSSQLIGQVATLTRCMAEACRAASYSSSLEGGYCKVWDSAVCDSMLLLGRFAWLLKVNGSFLTTSLSYSIPGAKPSNNSGSW